MSLRRPPFLSTAKFRKDNAILDKTFIYSYNGIGNITKVESYPYTTGDVSGTPTTVDYTYSGDKLTNFNGKVITYNSIGYPTSYDGKTWTWTKGKLNRIHKGSANQPGSAYIDCVFTYDAYGRRISKSYINDPNTASSNDYSYTYNTTYNYDNSGRLIREYCTEEYTYSGGSTGTREFIYLYDESGMIGVLYSRNGASLQPYYYRRNAQGDVIAIYDSAGNIKAEYAYDAWGNCTVTNSTLYDLAYNNPIRYRGYYYDRETGLYYLNARYYNSQWRRFISPDSTEYIDPENPNGLNLYAYCYNDPVNYADPSGHAPKWWESILIGIGIIAVASLISAAILCSAGCPIPFWAAVGQAALGGLKIAATAGATAGIIRAGKTAIEGGNIQDVGKSLVLGFSDGFLAGSIYAGIGMISAGLAYKVIGAIDYGYGLGCGWKEFSSSGTLLRQGMYLTPNVGGVVFTANHFGVNGGRSFSLDLDINNGLHYHSNKFSFGPKKIKRHNWAIAPIIIGLSIGFSDGWSEW